jgi:hypothetical protein
MVEIQPTGRGITMPLNGSCGSSARSRASGSKNSISVPSLFEKGIA